MSMRRERIYWTGDIPAYCSKLCINQLVLMRRFRVIVYTDLYVIILVKVSCHTFNLLLDVADVFSVHAADDPATAEYH